MRIALLRIMEKRTAKQNALLAAIVGPTRVGAMIDIIRARQTALTNVRKLTR